MGTYATVTGLAQNMIGTKFLTTTSETSVLAGKCITQAENEINKWLSRRYDIGSFLAAPPPLVTSLCETLAEGYMRIRQVRGANSAKEVKAYQETLINPVLENLKAISEYKANVVDSTGAVIPDSANTGAFQIHCSTSEYAPTFNEDAETRWKTDPDKLEDIAAERD